MPGLYTIATRAAGTIITALFYNQDHQVHVDGRTAALMAGFSSGLDQYRQVANPFPGNPAVESFAPSLAGEITRLRFEIAVMKKVLNGNTAVDQWYDDVEAPQFIAVGARVRRTTNQSTTSGVGATLNFTGGTEDFNESAVWSSGTPTRFTAPVDGKYMVACAVKWAGTVGTGRRQLSIIDSPAKAFDTDPRVTNTVAGTAHVQYQAVVGILALNVGEYCEFSAFQDSGSAIDLAAENATSIVGAMILFGR